MSDSHLVQLLVPLRDNAGAPFPPSHHAALRAELIDRFGGLTSYARAPAQGTWQEHADAPQHDDLVVYEVMVDVLDAPWWSALRTRLEQRFAQEELVIRAIRVSRL
jgi:hypothetical protein